MARVAMGFAVGLATGVALGAIAAWKLFEAGASPPLVEPGRSSGPSPPAESLTGEAIAPPASQPAAIDVPIARSTAPGPRVDPERGAGVICGQVTTARGEPFPGVRVRIERSGPDADPWRARPSDPPAERDAFLRDATATFGRLAAREVDTDAEGRYRFEDLPDGPHRVSARREGHSLHPRGRGGCERVLPGATLDFIAVPLLELPIRVIGTDGRLVPEAWIEFAAPSGRPGGVQRERWTAERPTVRIRPGAWKAKALAGGPGTDPQDAEIESETVQVTLRADEPPAPVTLVLRGGAGLRGQILDPDGLEDTAFRIYVLAGAPGTPPAHDELKRAGRSVGVGSNRSTYVIRDLAPGTYWLGVARGWYGLIAHVEAAEVGSGMMRRDIVLPPPAPGDFLLVRALGPSGDALWDLRFTISQESSQGSNSSSGFTATRRADGTWWCSPDETYRRAITEGKPDGVRLSLTVESESYGSKSLDLTPGDPRLVTVQFGDPARLALTVAGLAGSGHEGTICATLIRASAVASPGRQVHSAAQRVGPDGLVTIGPKEAGEHVVLLSVASGDPLHAFDAMPAGRFPVRLEPGANALTVPMPALSRLTVRLDGGDGAAVQIGSRDDEDWWWGPRSEVRGERAVFERVPPGEYRLHVWTGPHAGRMRVRVPEQSEVDFRPDPVDAVEVNVDDPQGPLAALGFRTGDVIQGAGGTGLRGWAHLAALVASASGSPEVRLDILRDGRTIQLGADPTRLLAVLTGERAMGGRLTPRSR